MERGQISASLGCKSKTQSLDGRSFLLCSSVQSVCIPFPVAVLLLGEEYTSDQIYRFKMSEWIGLGAAGKSPLLGPVCFPKVLILIEDD